MAMGGILQKRTRFRQYAVSLAVVLLVLLLVVASLGLGQRGVNAAFGDRITASNQQFYAGGQRIWINGANTPWDNWNDFGGDFDYAWWDSHFQQLHDNGINATRIWITCNGEVGINVNASGYVSGATQAHWDDLDSLFQIAQNRQVYIMATLISFDHFRDYHPSYTMWRNWIASNSNIDSYVDNYLIPFVNRYKNNPRANAFIRSRPCEDSPYPIRLSDAWS